MLVGKAMLINGAVKKSPVFADLNDENQKLVFSMMRERKIAKGETLFQERLVVDGIRQHRNVMNRLDQVSTLRPWTKDTGIPKRPPPKAEQVDSSFTQKLSRGFRKLRARSSSGRPAPPVKRPSSGDPSMARSKSKHDHLASTFLASVGEWGISADEYDGIEVDTSGEQPLSPEQIRARKQLY